VSERPPIKLIATDIDGTMLNSHGKLADEVKHSLHRAQDAGITVVPTTGRPKMVAQDVIEASQLEEYWIFANGAVTWHLGRAEAIRGHWIQAQLGRQLARRLQSELPNSGLAVEFEDSVAFQAGFEAIVPNPIGVPPITDMAAAIDERVQKILVFDPTLQIEELFKRVSQIVGDLAVPSFSGLPFIELAAESVTKGVAVSDLAADLGINQDEVAAFGDNHNDIPMLEWAGRSYAMGNGTDDAKEAAHHVIDTNDNHGLAQQVDALVAEWT
jgi:Cof subfamily protein (haloacid dehalogenase superfamily)